jgi:hypothetical protein
VKLAWARLGVPLDVVKWLSDLDHDGLTFPWTPHMMSHMYAHSDDKLLAKDNDHFITSPHLGFVAQRGIGQGDTMSTLIWMAVYYISFSR